MIPIQQIPEDEWAEELSAEYEDKLEFAREDRKAENPILDARLRDEEEDAIKEYVALDILQAKNDQDKF